MPPPAFALAAPLPPRARAAPPRSRRAAHAAAAPGRAPVRASIAAATAAATGAGAAAGGAGAESEHRLSAGVRARTVVAVGKSATLCTVSAKHAGVPFGSFCDFVLDAEGRPVLFLASGSEHTKNVVAEGRVSLYCSGTSGQAGCRVTLVGRLRRMADGEDEEVREDFVDAHAYAAEALEYPDLFSFYRMDVEDVFFVGGYGVVAEWVDRRDYMRGEADPIAADAGRIVGEINEARGGELRAMCEVYLGVHDAAKVTMMGLDRLGFDLRVKDGQGKIREYRVAFREAVENTFDCQSALVKAFQEAWERQNGFDDVWAGEESRPTVMYYALT